MKAFKYVLLIVLAITLAACGSSTSSTGSSVSIIGTDGTSASSSISRTTTQGAASAIYVLASRVCFTAGTDNGDDTFSCPDETSDLWDCVFDETENEDITSQCVDIPAADGDFTDLTLAQDMGENPSYAAGTYSCVMVTLCNKLAWATEDETLAGLCEDDFVTDISPSEARDGLGEGEVPAAGFYSYFWAVGGVDVVEDGNDGTAGSADNPFALNEALTIGSGSNTVNFVMYNNTDAGSGWVGTHNDEAPDSEQCGVEAPILQITQE